MFEWCLHVLIAVDSVNNKGTPMAHRGARRDSLSSVLIFSLTCCHYVVLLGASCQPIEVLKPSYIILCTVVRKIWP